MYVHIYSVFGRIRIANYERDKPSIHAHSTYVYIHTLTFYGCTNQRKNLVSNFFLIFYKFIIDEQGTLFNKCME